MSRDPTEEPTAEPAVPERRFMLVSAGGTLLALDVDDVREVVPSRPFTRLPGAPSYVCGLVNLRGRMVTVIDLSRRLRLPPASAEPSHRVVVLAYRGRAVGVAVDEVVRILPVAPESLTPVPAGGSEGAAADFLTHAGRLDRAAFHIVSTEGLLQPVFG